MNYFRLKDNITEKCSKLLKHVKVIIVLTSNIEIKYFMCLS